MGRRRPEWASSTPPRPPAGQCGQARAPRRPRDAREEWHEVGPEGAMVGELTGVGSTGQVREARAAGPRHRSPGGWICTSDPPVERERRRSHPASLAKPAPWRNNGAGEGNRLQSSIPRGRWLRTPVCSYQDPHQFSDQEIALRATPARPKRQGGQRQKWVESGTAALEMTKTQGGPPEDPSIRNGENAEQWELCHGRPRTHTLQTEILGEMLRYSASLSER